MAKRSKKKPAFGARLSTVLMWCAFGVLSTVLAVVMFLNLFCHGEKYACRKEFLLPNIVLLILSTAIFIGLSFLLKKAKFKIFERRDYKIINIVSIVLFIGMIYIALNTFFQPGWDAGVVTGSARRSALMMFGNEQNTLAGKYFSHWPNNHFLLLIETLLFKIDNGFGIVSGDNGLMILVGFQCLLMVITGNVMFRIIHKKTKSKKFAWIGWGIFVILLALSGWLLVPYTDVMAICFPVLIYYSYLKKEESKKHKIWWWVLIGALSYFGYKMKPTAIIMLIAILAGEFVFGIAKKEKGRLKEMAKGGAALLASVVVSSFAFSMAFKLTKVEVDNNYNMGVLHMLMMGLNKESNGVWSESDVYISEHFQDDAAGRKAAQKEEIAKRLSEFGFGGLLEHGKRKALTIFNDGTFAWGNEGNFYAITYPLRNEKMGAFLRDVTYHTGEKYKVKATVQQAVWLFVLLFSALGILLKKDKNLTILIISLVGIILFNFLFEARARYLFVFAPVFIIVATFVLQNVTERLATFKWPLKKIK
ncbi:glycosyltransferase family 39 protein [Candidatus Saccharibacteria bacterium]|nr:glycosyltransferase family 39 protein [Candidatus Saccharibacteria bacterium]